MKHWLHKGLVWAPAPEALNRTIKPHINIFFLTYIKLKARGTCRDSVQRQSPHASLTAAHLLPLAALSPLKYRFESRCLIFVNYKPKSLCNPVIKTLITSSHVVTRNNNMVSALFIIIIDGNWGQEMQKIKSLQDGMSSEAELTLSRRSCTPLFVSEKQKISVM